jgi:hypothetical protein
MNRLARTIAHTLGVLALAWTTHALLDSHRGIRLALELINWGGYIPFAISTACGLNNQRTLLALTTAAVLLTAYPTSTAGVADCMTPLGAGIIAGTLLRRSLNEFTEEDDERQPIPHHPGTRGGTGNPTDHHP